RPGRHAERGGRVLRRGSRHPHRDRPFPRRARLIGHDGGGGGGDAAGLLPADVRGDLHHPIEDSLTDSTPPLVDDPTGALASSSEKDAARALAERYRPEYVAVPPSAPRPELRAC